MLSLRQLGILLVAATALGLLGCGSAPRTPSGSVAGNKAPRAPANAGTFRLSAPSTGTEIVLVSLGLLDTGYQFGGRNPEAGLDCSGMVSYVVEKVSGRRLPHNAAQIAELTREIERDELAPGDLVFFNTNGNRYSHMGIYLGDARFVHAPSSRGKVRVERMDNRYFAARFSGARTLF